MKQHISVEQLDNDGYPTDIVLDKIEKWDIKDLKGLVKYVEGVWSSYGWSRIYWGKDVLGKPVKKWRLDTGGWSGNESIIGALERNTMFMLLCWEQSRRGGHYIYELKKLKKDKK